MGMWLWKSWEDMDVVRIEARETRMGAEARRSRGRACESRSEARGVRKLRILAYTSFLLYIPKLQRYIVIMPQR
jgi:hypothetical protein